MMASAWAASFPVVKVRRDNARPKRVTLIVPYYESPAFFLEQIVKWNIWPSTVWNHVQAIVVDDGSPTHPLAHPGDTFVPISLRTFRIDVDVPWNWLAARNIGAHYAHKDSWLLLTDMDHIVPPETIEAVVYGRHDPAVVYAFSRREYTGQPVTPHSASFLMTRAMFWAIGGYDERLSGVYGTDGLFRRRVLARAKVQVLTDALVRYEYVGDSSVIAYERKTDTMARARQARLQSIPPNTPPKVLTFPYHELTA